MRLRAVKLRISNISLVRFLVTIGESLFTLASLAFISKSVSHGATNKSVLNIESGSYCSTINSANEYVPDVHVLNTFLCNNRLEKQFSPNLDNYFCKCLTG